MDIYAIDWDAYFMGVALLSAKRSKDPNTKVGACIVNEDKKIVGIGYNGMPIGCGDEDMPWGRENDDPLKTKYPYVCHAELNAILNSNQMSLKGCTIYATLFPCNECAKAIIQAGIKKVVFYDNKYEGTDSVKASQFLFRVAGVTTKEYVRYSNSVSIEL